MANLLRNIIIYYIVTYTYMNMNSYIYIYIYIHILKQLNTLPWREQIT